MRITAVRRISQIFFFVLFIWFCIVSSLGESFWQLRGWPVNWFLQLDPLVALGNLLTTSTLYSGLLWALATVGITVVLGRFFCGWLCPFGSIHHFVSWLGFRGKTAKERIAANRYRGPQRIKYYLLLVLLSAAAGSFLIRAADASQWNPLWIAGILLLAAAAAVLAKRGAPRLSRLISSFLAMAALWSAAGYFLKLDGIVSASLQSGLLDPIPLVYRSTNLVLLPFSESSLHVTSAAQRYYDGAWLIAVIFFAAVLLNLVIPRFYCRFVCPLGALFGVLGKFALWRVGKKERACRECMLCDARCEGACNPAERIHIPECVLCMNCLNTCKQDLIGYHTFRSASGEAASPDLSRRGFVAASISGIAAIPLLRIDGKMGQNWNHGLVRPPGSLPESEFLNRCIKCGQCARVCPTNVIQLDTSSKGGIEGLWTPALNFRAGSSGCQLNCTACSHICPTAAIRPLSLQEKLGRGSFERSGPVRIGTAFVDRGRCLPWAMDKPCIVCQENCPVSPKAIFVKETYTTIRGGDLEAAGFSGSTVELTKPVLLPERFGTGDFYLLFNSDGARARRRITANTEGTIILDSKLPLELERPAAKNIELQVRLQSPQIDPERCIGCGICEHECPVSGLRAIRVSGEGESRHKKHSLLLK
ncbi:MAG: 4Fe-4S binding protein [Syntrophobacteraceae bacterium]